MTEMPTALKFEKLEMLWKIKEQISVELNENQLGNWLVEVHKSSIKTLEDAGLEVSPEGRIIRKYKNEALELVDYDKAI